MSTAVYIKNIVACAAAKQYKTPFEVCCGYQPRILHLKFSEAVGYAHIGKSKISKFNKKAYKYM